MADNPPYMLQPGSLKSALEKIKHAATPERFTGDFLAETLGMKGGNARPVIPYLKKVGFLSSDGTPTDLYRRFRNPSETGRAAAEGLRVGYKKLFDINERAHELGDSELGGLIVQATGLERGSSTVRAILGSFKVLRSFAKFSDKPLDIREEIPPVGTPPQLAVVAPQSNGELGIGMNLSYTINLNLPATTDIAVFNAIFRSLRENLLKG